MKWVKHGVRFLLVTVGIIVLTSFTIDATDALNGSQSALSILARHATEGECPAGMQVIDLAEGRLCADIFEVSPYEDCPEEVVNSSVATQNNLNHPDCQAVSQAAATPWVFVSYYQAKQMCAKREARLPTAREWYELAVGTREEDCNIDGKLTVSGEYSDCQSVRGIHDMVGNAWEWVDEEVVDGMYRSRALPAEGYVAETDTAGVATETGNDGVEQFGSDYFWHQSEGVYAMMRGGFYGSDSDAGVYAVHTEVKPSFSSGAIGFRCVASL